MTGQVLFGLFLNKFFYSFDLLGPYVLWYSYSSVDSLLPTIRWMDPKRDLLFLSLLGSGISGFFPRNCRSVFEWSSLKRRVVEEGTKEEFGKCRWNREGWWLSITKSVALVKYENLDYYPKGSRINRFHSWSLTPHFRVLSGSTRSIHQVELVNERVRGSGYPNKSFFKNQIIYSTYPYGNTFQRTIRDVNRVERIRRDWPWIRSFLQQSTIQWILNGTRVLRHCP